MSDSLIAAGRDGAADEPDASGVTTTGVAVAWFGEGECSLGGVLSCAHAPMASNPANTKLVPVMAIRARLAA
ncbi:MAG: hypothetical protein AB7O24_05395 [Kofleriaceae bacterium]